MFLPHPCDCGAFGSGTRLAVPAGMIRLEQVRSEMLDRFERVDRRFAQNEQRLARIDQRTADLCERLESVVTAMLRHLEQRPAARDGLPEDAGAAVAAVAATDD
jgi:hypothetical protein